MREVNQQHIGLALMGTATGLTVLGFLGLGTVSDGQVAALLSTGLALYGVGKGAKAAADSSGGGDDSA